MSLAARCVHGVGLCVLPKAENDFRPWALRHKPLALVSLFLLLAKAAAVGMIALTPSTAELSTITSQRIIQLTNTERTSAGLSALSINPLLSEAAKQKGQHMLQEDYFAHISPSGVTPWFWMKKVGYGYYIAGENLAIDFNQAEDVVTAWLNSPTHKENMLHPEYTETGVAAVTGEFLGGTSTIVVHMFGRPVGTAAAGEPAPAPVSVPGSTPVSAPTSLPESVPTPPPSLRVPRITLQDSKVVGNLVALRVDSDPDTNIHILVNQQDRLTLKTDQGGSLVTRLSLDAIPDGVLSLRAFASAGQRRSDLTSPLVITKDTSGPALSRENIQFVLAPSFDRPVFLYRVLGAGPETESSWVPVSGSYDSASISARDEVGNATTVNDIKLLPQFQSLETLHDLRVPEQVIRFSRRFIWTALAAMILLLLMAIIIRIQIQRPGMIGHASLVIFLGLLLLLI